MKSLDLKNYIISEKNIEEISNIKKWDDHTLQDLFALPFLDLLTTASLIHRKNFKPSSLQVSNLLSIKTGACPEDCKYCAQSARYNTDIKTEKFMSVDEIMVKAKKAQEMGAHRFCLGAAWRNLRDRDLDKIITVIKEIKKLDLELCLTLGMVTKEQAQKLKEAGLDYYNHNIDTSADLYKKIVTTRKYQDRIDTVNNIKEAGINLCCGVIIGLGESLQDKCDMIKTLHEIQPTTLPINLFIKIKGTPLANIADVNIFDFISFIAVVRIILPKTVLRLSAGRSQMSKEAQAFCFMAGVSSIFCGEKLLTAENSPVDEDDVFFKKLGINITNKIFAE